MCKAMKGYVCSNLRLCTKQFKAMHIVMQETYKTMHGHMQSYACTEWRCM